MHSISEKLFCFSLLFLCYVRTYCSSYILYIGGPTRKGEPGDADSVRPGQLNEFGHRGPSSLRHKYIVRCHVFDKSVYYGG
jgi:hypothetical protein